MKVFGDNLLVELQKSEWATADEQGEHDDPRAVSGTVIAIPDEQDILYFGSFNWAFDKSMLDDVTRKDLVKIMKRLQGRKVYWEKHADKGTTIHEGDKILAVIKLSKIIGVEE